jgi:ribosomal-protein-alanine N-acetyltransferase
MHTRPAAQADIPVLLELERSASTAAHWSPEQYHAAFSSDGPSRIILVIEDETGGRGFIVGRAVCEEWEVENLVVGATARRLGLGAHLLKAFVDLARGRGAQAIFLEVRESNIAARRLYEKFSFRETGRRKAYYHEPGEDAILLRIELC